MNYYCAVDNKVNAKIPWKYFQIRRWKPENYLKSRLKHPMPLDTNTCMKIASNRMTFDEAFNLMSSQHNKKMNMLSIVKNACINYMRHHNEAFCINILKRVKKDKYELVERIYPDGMSEIDENVTGWDWITDYDFNEENTFEL